MIEITEGKCMVCKKELPLPLVVCFKCSSTKKETIFQMLNQYVKENKKK